MPKPNSKTGKIKSSKLPGIKFNNLTKCLLTIFLAAFSSLLDSQEFSLLTSSSSKLKVSPFLFFTGTGTSKQTKFQNLEKFLLTLGF